MLSFAALLRLEVCDQWARCIRTSRCAFGKLEDSKAIEFNACRNIQCYMPRKASKLTWNKIDYPKTKCKTPSNSPLESLLYAQDSQQIYMGQNRLPKNQMKNTFKLNSPLESLLYAQDSQQTNLYKIDLENIFCCNTLVFGRI